MSLTIFYNARIQTQDPHLPVASAVALEGSRIRAVGTDAEVDALANAQSVRINLEGRRVLPGLTDAHFHYYEWAFGRQRLELTRTRSIAELQTLLGEKARASSPGAWIMGRGWNENNWSDRRLISRADLDALTPLNPTLLVRGDGHMAVANSLALAAAHLNSESPDPPQGVIDREAGGQPSGVLRELAINLIRKVIPPYTDDETVRTLRAGFHELHQLGLTGVHDFRSLGGRDGPPALRAYQLLRAAGELALRMWALLPGERLDEAIALGLRTGFGDEVLRLGQVKFFTDGSQGSRSAWMLDPYEDTQTFGMPLQPMQEILEALQRAHAAGLSLAIHAIGDRANRELVNVFELAKSTAGNPALAAPDRIEHAQNIRPEDVARLGQLGVVASVQPIHLPDDISMIEQSVGARGRWSYPFQGMTAAGVPLAFGSDSPVASANPFWGIHAAVTRSRQDGTPAGGFYPGQSLSVDQAVHGYSMGAAAACGRQADLGSITPGKLADLVVLEQDIYSIEPNRIFEVKPFMTVFAGQIVHQA